MNLLTGASLFLDFDGTLVDLAERPDAVVVDARLGTLLRRLGDVLNGRLAIVSGRPVEQIEAFFPDMPLSISGSHGLEMRWAGETFVPTQAPAWIAEARARAERLGAEHPGMIVETKPHGIAIHYRRVPAAEAACLALAGTMAGPGRHLQPGKMVIEVRADGGDKGTAIHGFMADQRMAGTRPVFIGDDLTDEPAFVAAAALGGAGILVGTARQTTARYVLPDVAATIAWLEAAIRENA